MSLARTALALALVASPAAAATTFDVEVLAPFIDIADGTQDDAGVITGFFTAHDLDGDGVVEAEDLGPWSFSGAGFADDAFNRTLSSASADAGVLVNARTPVDIGAGLSAEVLDFFQNGQLLGVQIDFRLGDEVDFFNFNETGTVFTSSNFSVTPRTPPAPVPLPATLPALAAALAALALARRRVLSLLFLAILGRPRRG
ncbi:hypothetical protein [Rubrimonas cliftonensis]|uniref:VPLPA-CTERM protein sorting domain-containing protein n=1 Tax=Rubrimonas cliftonensis TaxID=89524 RepID=A0A1H4G7S0_9RHOB|nr:hypothetical protein [Rubrimonas cliftonensis]SEB04732.1 hypothetical protein SAMN05444370_1388 [Rubrimonas cliftonensis]